MKIQTLLKKHSKELTAGAVFLITYIPSLIWMRDRWFAADSYYSHGILIPFVSGFFIWQKRDALAKIRKTSSPWGIKLIILGLTVYMLSALFRVNFSAAFSMFIVLCGLILHFYGTAFLRAIWFPVAFLLFMIPLPSVVISNISFRMKLFAAQIATGVLNNIGIPALREGSLVKMRHAYVVVDDVCSGLRSLISLTALAAVFAYWMHAARAKRIALFLLAGPIAVITNVVRVIFLAFVAEVWGTQYAEGFLHDLSGFMVFALAFAMLFGVMKVIE